MRDKYINIGVALAGFWAGFVTAVLCKPANLAFLCVSAFLIILFIGVLAYDLWALAYSRTTISMYLQEISVGNPWVPLTFGMFIGILGGVLLGHLWPVR